MWKGLRWWKKTENGEGHDSAHDFGFGVADASKRDGRAVPYKGDCEGSDRERIVDRPASEGGRYKGTARRGLAG